ncbi:MAG TPA: hypothetical protein VGZ29_01255 [Terriglobia bacterium]|nr:hypothetical protein [Terriglobia bacterium]
MQVRYLGPRVHVCDGGHNAGGGLLAVMGEEPPLMGSLLWRKRSYVIPAQTGIQNS